MGLDPLQLAIDGGEDYELLFTVPKRLAARLPGQMDGVPITVIGEIVHGKGITLVDAEGHSRPLQASGWDPFRK
jgi:thiamine-monophosphate kinase